MSIYVRVKELWAFGVAHKLAVIIMILASLPGWPVVIGAGYARLNQLSIVQARPSTIQTDISIQASNFLRDDASHDLQPAVSASKLSACYACLPPISPNFLAQLLRRRIDAAIFPQISQR